jgi:hypothetical protein
MGPTLVLSLDSSPRRPRFLGVEELLVAASGWDSRFPDGDGWFGTGTQQHPRDGVAADAIIRSRSVQLLKHLEAVHGMQEQPIRDIADYQGQCWGAGDIPSDRSCVLIGTGDETWLWARREQEQLAFDGTDRSRASNREGGGTPSVSLGEPKAALCSSDSARRTSSGMKRDRATSWLPTKGLGGYLYAVGSQTLGPEGSSIG